MKTHTAALVEQVNQSRQPVIITQNGEPRAVVQDIASFERTRNTLMLPKLATQGEAEIQAGRAARQATALAEIKKRMRLA